MYRPEVYPTKQKQDDSIYYKTSYKNKTCDPNFLLKVLIMKKQDDKKFVQKIRMKGLNHF